VPAAATRPGGWGAILIYMAIIQRNCREEMLKPRNNRMELIAVISAVDALKEPCKVELFTDSQYIVNAVIWAGFSDWKKKAGNEKSGS
jgi:ribonuclease HI